MYHLLIIGGGLSGIAAGIRAARFGLKTLILEQHNHPGGLNSYYFRQGHLLETGLHAMTNFAPARQKHAPLNRLLRQLNLRRRQFDLHEQIASEICFNGRSLLFTNDPVVLEAEVAREFPRSVDQFRQVKERIANHDPFTAGPRRSARQFLADHLHEQELVDMLLLPLMVYGNAEEEDMDLDQFVIMFRAIFVEGFFRPAGTIRDFLDLLLRQYHGFGGELRLRCPVAGLLTKNGRINGAQLADGEVVTAQMVLSTAGIPETMRLVDWPASPQPYIGRMSFMETVVLVPREYSSSLSSNRTILFYHEGEELRYRRPQDYLDTSWGVICFPGNFSGLEPADRLQVRMTNAANYALWKKLTPESYPQVKRQWTEAAIAASEKMIGNYRSSIVYQDSFTPVTIERYTRKAEGAVYGSSIKIKNGMTPWPNLYLAGTDQGFLGIIGSMLSGITIVNQHILQQSYAD